MKVELTDITLAHSSLSDKTYAGVINKSKTKWLHKTDVTDSFIACVISRWENQKEVIFSGKDKWEITVKKLN
jgi:hypothetical protein